MRLAISQLLLCLDKTTLLKDISFSLDAGSICAVVGPNGSGKTSLLRTISGEVGIGKGQVLLNGDDVHKMSMEERAMTLAVLPQASALAFPFTAREVVAMGRIPHGTSRKKDIELADKVLLEMGLMTLSDRDYLTLSGGEKQRVQLARVFCQIWDVQPTACLLLDEPTAALDLAHQLALFGILRRLANSGASILVVLHDINLAMRFADQVLLLNDGAVLSSGEPADVLNVSNIREAFGVDPGIFPTDDSGRPFIIARTKVN